VVFDGAFDNVAMGGVVFHAASGLNAIAIAQVQDSVRRGLLPDDVAQAMAQWVHSGGLMAQWAHSGGFSVDASVRIAVSDGAVTCLRNFERFIPGKWLGVEGLVGSDGAA
jgi:hypothetical protein